jgi:hypothetical protein
MKCEIEREERSTIRMKQMIKEREDTEQKSKIR